LLKKFAYQNCIFKKNISKFKNLFQQDTFLVLITPFSLITDEGTPGPDMFLTRTGRGATF